MKRSNLLGGLMLVFAAAAISAGAIVASNAMARSNATAGTHANGPDDGGTSTTDDQLVTDDQNVEEPEEPWESEQAAMEEERQGQQALQYVRCIYTGDDVTGLVDDPSMFMGDMSEVEVIGMFDGELKPVYVMASNLYDVAPPENLPESPPVTLDVRAGTPDECSFLHDATVAHAAEMNRG